MLLQVEFERIECEYCDRTGYEHGEDEKTEAYWRRLVRFRAAGAIPSVAFGLRGRGRFGIPALAPTTPTYGGLLGIRGALNPSGPPAFDNRKQRKCLKIVGSDIGPHQIRGARASH